MHIKKNLLLWGLAAANVGIALLVAFPFSSRALPVTPTPSEDEAVLGQSVCGVLAPLDIMLVIDQSSSMLDADPSTGSPKMDGAKQAATFFVNTIAAIAPKTNIGLVKFAGSVSFPNRPTAASLAVPLTTNYTQLKAAINAITPPPLGSSDDGTCIECGLLLANDNLEALSKKKTGNLVILLTDGIANDTTTSNGLANVTTAEAEAAAMNRVLEGVSIQDNTYHTIGVGTGINNIHEAFLEQIAVYSGGLYYNDPTDGSLQKIFDNILDAEFPCKRVSGSVFIDANQNSHKDAGEINYPGSITINSSTGTLITTNGDYIISGITPGANVTVSYSNLPGGYTLLSPLNGPPPSFQVGVGSSCTTNGAPDAVCSNGSVSNLNFALTDSSPWMQIYGLDARFENGYSNTIPQSSLYPAYSLVKDTTSNTPGILFTGDGITNLGSAQASTTDWEVGGSLYPEVMSTTEGMSYTSLSEKATRANVPQVDLATLTTCKNLANCTLSPNLPSGVYTATGNVVLHGYTFPANRNYVFLINGTVTIDGSIIVPNGSVAFFAAKQDIVVARTVAAAANTSPLPASQLQGVFSAGRDMIVEGTTNCATFQDKMLNIEGAIIVNAGANGGTFTNNRNLCGDNGKYPSVTMRDRLDFLLNMPTFLLKQVTSFQESL